MATAPINGIRRAAARLAPDDAGDGELLARYLHGRDEPAFAAVVRRHSAMVFGTCRRVLGTAADADDAFQAAFVVLLRKAPGLTDRVCVGNFLYGVAVRTALKARAMAARRRVKEARVLPPPEATADVDLSQALDEELAKLPEKYRAPVVLCELGGVPRKAAAATLGVPEGTLSSRLATAHKLLAKRLTARGFAVAGLAGLFAAPTVAAPETLFTATLRAAAAGPSPAVAHLVTEVTKMLFLTKLKLGTAAAVVVAGIGFGVAPRGTAADEPKPATKSGWPSADKINREDAEGKKLHGTWVTRTFSTDPPVPKGLGINWPRSTWTFDRIGLVSLTTSEAGGAVTKLCRFTVDPSASPTEMSIFSDRTLMQCLYKLDDDVLTVAFYVRSEVARPKGFARKDHPKDADPLVTLEFVRADDREQLQGLWQAESVTAGGSAAPADVVAKFRLRFAGDAVTILPDDRTHAFKLNPKAEPKELDLTPGDGDAKGKVLPCAIYKLDGDTLTICIDKEGETGKRPTEFKAANGYALIVLKRVKDAKAGVVKP